MRIKNCLKNLLKKRYRAKVNKMEVILSEISNRMAFFQNL